MNDFHELADIIKGEIDVSDESLTKYSHDASMFELRPTAVISPANTADVCSIVTYVSEHKAINPSLSITARSAGTDMSGGAINQSLLLDFTNHFNNITTITSTEAHVQPGVYYRDLEPETLKFGSYFPSYPASRDLCTMGGIVANNSGGEKSLSYGKTERYVNELHVVFSDGKEYIVKPINKSQLVVKIKQNDFEGKLYAKVYDLINKNYDLIQSSKPPVNKDSTGYHLWDVWNRKSEIFDLTQLIVGSQGTLGLITDIKLRLVKKAAHSGLLVCYMKSLDQLGEVINKVLTHHPESFESFDDHTLYLSFKFFPYFRKTLGWKGLAKLGISLIPDALALVHGIPKLVLLIEFTDTTIEGVREKVQSMHNDLNVHKLTMTYFEEDETEIRSKKFWIMRRESFNLLRNKVKDKHTAPFMDDLVVPTKSLPEFLPQIRQIITKYNLLATIAGHMGDGNFHIIPLMKIEDPKEKAKLEPAMREINALILKYHGSLSGEHNDGMIRGPWLKDMYGPEMYHVLKEVKNIFDPHNIFNPHKKTDANWDFSMANLRDTF